jgi:hypothetical protein
MVTPLGQLPFFIEYLKQGGYDYPVNPAGHAQLHHAQGHDRRLVAKYAWHLPLYRKRLSDRTALRA